MNTDKSITKKVVLRLFLSALALAFVLTGCGGGGGKGGGGNVATTAASTAKAITAFSLAGVTANVNETYKVIGVVVPFGTNVSGLVATFSTIGADVKVGGVSQVSGATANDFTNPVIYTVTAADATTVAYTVTVVVAPSTAKAITAFSLAGVTGTINETNKTIAVTMPFGTDVTALVATFTTSGASVAVGATTQVSGTTPKDFTGPVSYVVSAADGTTASYTVTVAVAANPAKALTAFSLAGVVGVINETNKTIAVTMPYGTNVTGLIATFSTTGSNVVVGTISQISGNTPNNFTYMLTYTVIAADGTTASYTVSVAVALNPAKAITAFALAGVTGTINETNKTIAVTMPYGTSVTALIATFTTSGFSVKIGSTTQYSGFYANNFTNPVIYSVTAADGTTANYTVTVAVALNPAKAITAFSLAGVTGTINETNKTIAVTMPYGTNVTALIATFSTTGVNVMVGTTSQISGTTPNDFTNPLIYVVSAADGTTASYTVTVTVAPSPAKAITAFSLAGVIGTINEANKTIVITMPSGTNVTALVATFTTTGINVKVGSLAQISGFSANDFTNPVVYTVTAANGSFVNYSAVVNIGTTPVVNRLSSNISRMVVNGTSVAIDVTILPNNFTFTGTLYATATDPAGIFMPAVSVTTSGGGYTLSLLTSTTVPAGHYTGIVTLNLCSDLACTVLQQVPSIAVPFDINVMTPTSAWPGNNLAALLAWTGVPDWAMFQGNAAHTGYVPVDVDPNKFLTRWNQPVVSAPGSKALSNTLTTANGQFFVAGNNILYARKELDGSTVWQYNFSGLPFPSANPPAVANGVVYIAAGQQSSTFMFAFNAADGTLVFKSPMTSQWEYYLAPTIGANGIYTNAGTFGGLYAFNGTGTQLYFSSKAQTSMWTPAVDGTGVYTYTGGQLQVVDPVSGAVLHTISDPTFANYLYEIGGSPVLGAAGSVFVANYENSLLNGGAIGNTLTNFNLSTNSIGWQVSGVYPSTPAYSAGILYVANNNPLRLEIRTEANGALLWSWTPPQAGEVSFNSEVLLTNNLVFISTNLATYAIDVMSHKTVWSYPQMGRLGLSQNGVLYIQGTSLLTAINLK